MMNGVADRPERRRCSRRARTAVLDGKVRRSPTSTTPGLEAGERQHEDGAPPSPRSARTSFDGVYSANDGMAGGIITALKAAGRQRRPAGHAARTPNSPVVQRIVAGDQYLSIYKPYAPEADDRRRDGRRARQGREARLHRQDQGRQPQPPRASPSVLVPVSLADQGQHQGHRHQGRRLHGRARSAPAKYKAACDEAGLK